MALLSFCCSAPCMPCVKSSRMKCIGERWLLFLAGAAIDRPSIAAAVSMAQGPFKISYFDIRTTNAGLRLLLLLLSGNNNGSHTQERRALKTMRINAELELISNRMECLKKIDPFSDSRNFSFVWYMKMNDAFFYTGSSNVKQYSVCWRSTSATNTYTAHEPALIFRHARNPLSVSSLW